MLTPIIGNPAQFLPYTPTRQPIPVQLCQKRTPSPENRGHSDHVRPDDIPNQPSSIPLNNLPPPNITTVADGLRNMTLQPHPQRNEWVTGCLECGKSYDPVIEETTADYLNQTPQSGETVRESKETLSLMAFRAESSLLSPRECRRLPPVTVYSTPPIITDINKYL